MTDRTVETAKAGRAGSFSVFMSLIAFDVILVVICSALIGAAGLLFQRQFRTFDLLTWGVGLAILLTALDKLARLIRNR